MDVERVRVDEWETLRDLRLRALEEAPEAFGASFDEARRRPEEWWRAWCRRSAESDEQAMFTARLDGRPAGMAGVFFEAGVWNVVAMWVTPETRGRGVGRLLLEAAVSFAREHGPEAIELGVTDGNDPARSVYEGYGFVDTGRAEPLESHPELTVRYLRLTGP